jgi:hypothetical protein
LGVGSLAINYHTNLLHTAQPYLLLTVVAAIDQIGSSLVTACSDILVGAHHFGFSGKQVRKMGRPV